MENSESPATSADPAALREEMRELEVKVEARFQQFAKHVESLFDRMGPQIVATVYRLGDAAPMRITGAEREAAGGEGAAFRRWKRAAAGVGAARGYEDRLPPSIGTPVPDVNVLDCAHREESPDQKPDD